MVLDKSSNLVSFFVKFTVLEISNCVSSVNPVKPDNWVNTSKLDKLIVVKDVDLETSNESNVYGKLANPVIPEGVLKVNKRVNCDNCGKLVRFIDAEISKKLNEGDKLEAVNSVSPEGVAKLSNCRVRKLFGNVCKLLDRVRYNSRTLLGKIGNAVIPEEVVNVLKLGIVKDKFGKLVINVDDERFNVLTEMGKMGNPVIPEGVVKLDRLYNGDKSGKLVINVDGERSKVCNNGNQKLVLNSVNVEDVVNVTNRGKLLASKPLKLVINIDAERFKFSNDGKVHANPVNPADVLNDCITLGKGGGLVIDDELETSKLVRE